MIHDVQEEALKIGMSPGIWNDSNLAGKTAEGRLDIDPFVA